MSNYGLKFSSINSPQFVGPISSLFLSYLKIFSLATVLTIGFVCILNTILPKQKSKPEVNPLSDLALIKNSLIKNPPTNQNIPQHDLRSLNKVRSNISLEQVRVAINHGTYSKLSILRPEILGDNLVRETALLPEVKSLLLSRLKFLMTQDDWTSWKELLHSNNSVNTNAREFVDNVTTVNFQLGRFLETAGLLFSSLYLKTANGSVFSTEQALYTLVQQSNSLFHLRAPKAISSRVYLDTLITDDSIFTAHLEELRAALIVSYARKEPNEIETQLILLGTVTPENFSNEIVKIYTEILNHVNKISPRFREEIRSHYFSPDVAKRLVKNNINLSSALFSLYEVVINDSIEKGDLSKAKSNYLHLASFSENSEALNSLQLKIDSTEEKITTASIESSGNVVPEATANKPGLRLFPEGQSDTVDITSKIQTYSLILALGLFVMILFKRFRSLVFALLVLTHKLTLKLFKKIFKIDGDKETLTDELDASIKAGKTVPMKSLPRSRQANKKAANF